MLGSKRHCLKIICHRGLAFRICLPLWQLHRCVGLFKMFFLSDVDSPCVTMSLQQFLVMRTRMTGQRRFGLRRSPGPLFPVGDSQKRRKQKWIDLSAFQASPCETNIDALHGELSCARRLSPEATSTSSHFAGIRASLQASDGSESTPSPNGFFLFSPSVFGLALRISNG